MSSQWSDERFVKDNRSPSCNRADVNSMPEAEFSGKGKSGVVLDRGISPPSPKRFKDEQAVFEGYYNPAFEFGNGSTSEVEPSVQSEGSGFKSVFLTEVSIPNQDRWQRLLETKEMHGSEAMKSSDDVTEVTKEQHSCQEIPTKEHHFSSVEDVAEETFHLAEDSSLFSQVSQSTMGELSDNYSHDAIVDTESTRPQCHMVEVRAMEISRGAAASSTKGEALLLEEGVVQRVQLSSPGAAERVEIEEEEEDDTDDEDSSQDEEGEYVVSEGIAVTVLKNTCHQEGLSRLILSAECMHSSPRATRPGIWSECSITPTPPPTPAADEEEEVGPPDFLMPTSNQGTNRSKHGMLALHAKDDVTKSVDKSVSAKVNDKKVSESSAGKMKCGNTKKAVVEVKDLPEMMERHNSATDVEEKKLGKKMSERCSERYPIPPRISVSPVPFDNMEEMSGQGYLKGEVIVPGTLAESEEEAVGFSEISAEQYGEGRDRVGDADSFYDSDKDIDVFLEHSGSDSPLEVLECVSFSGGEDTIEDLETVSPLHSSSKIDSHSDHPKDTSPQTSSVALIPPTKAVSPAEKSTSSDLSLMVDNAVTTCITTTISTITSVITTVASLSPLPTVTSSVISQQSPAVPTSPQQPSFIYTEEVKLKSYLGNVDQMLKKMSSSLATVRSVEVEVDPGKRLVVLESELSALAPDVASLISCGDSLVLNVHAKDPAQALHLAATQDALRNKWQDFKSVTEKRKAEAQDAENKLKSLNAVITSLQDWLSEINKRMEAANNDEGQIQVLQSEFEKQAKSVEQLEVLYKHLSEVRMNPLSSSVKDNLLSKWKKACEHFQCFGKELGSAPKTVVSKTVEMDKPDKGVCEFVTRVNLVREGVSALSRRMSGFPSVGHEYDAFTTQEELLKDLKEGLALLKVKVDEVEYDRDSVMRRARGREQGDQARRVVDKLREEWSQVNRAYAERHSRWVKCNEIWKGLETSCSSFSEWLAQAESMVASLSEKELPLEEARIKQKELEKQVTTRHRTMTNICKWSREVVARSSGPESVELQEKVDGLLNRWRVILAELTMRRDKIAAMEAAQKEKKSESGARMESSHAWLAQVRSLFDSPANPSDEASLNARLRAIKVQEEELLLRKKEVEKTKGGPLSPEQLKVLSSSMEKVHEGLLANRDCVERRLASLSKYNTRLDESLAWAADARATLARNDVKEVFENFTNLEKECQGTRQPVSSELQKKIKKLKEDWNYLRCQVAESGTCEGSPTVAAAAHISQRSPEEAKVQKTNSEAAKRAEATSG
ncbi:hypothetical protein J437_LFUL015544, partial [Ladona fulva]